MNSRDLLRKQLHANRSSINHRLKISWPIPIFAFLYLLTVHAVAYGQASGSRGGIANGIRNGPTFDTPLDQTVQEYIVVEGSIELRVVPDQIRIVLAIVVEGETPSECQQKVDSKIANLCKLLIDQGVPAANIVDDFISVLPRYGFSVETSSVKSGKNDTRDSTIAVERIEGYTMQSNLHIKSDDDAGAKRILEAAFSLDIVTLGPISSMGQGF